MLPSSRRFEPDHISVYKHDQPDLYELAESALLGGNGTFAHLGYVWQVGEGEGLLGDYLNIRRKA